MTIKDTLNALKSSIDHQDYEQAACYLCDLLNYCGNKIIGDIGLKRESYSNLHLMIHHYGQKIERIEG